MTDVIGELVGRDRRSDRLALYDATADRTYSYFDLCNTAAKAGNVLRHVGVRPGDPVWIEPRPDPEPVVTCLGAVQLGAVVRFVGPHDGNAGWLADEQPEAVVVHAAAESAASPDPGTSLVVYGGEPAGTAVTHWETEVWSENPAAPPAPVGTDNAALAAGSDSHTHRALLAAAETARERGPITDRTAVVVRASLAEPRAVAAGVLAPLAAGGAVTLPDGDRPVVVDCSANGDTSRLADHERLMVGENGPLDPASLRLPE